jgi:hypothetical protein
LSSESGRQPNWGREDDFAGRLLLGLDSIMRWVGEGNLRRSYTFSGGGLGMAPSGKAL